MPLDLREKNVRDGSKKTISSVSCKMAGMRVEGGGVRINLLKIHCLRLKKNELIRGERG